MSHIHSGRYTHNGNKCSNKCNSFSLCKSEFESFLVSKTAASMLQKISQKCFWKWVMRPWPHPFRGSLSIVIHGLRFDTFYLCAKFDDSSLNRSRDIIGTPEFKVGHVTLTTPPLQVICHRCVGSPKFQCSCDLTMPLSGMICHPRASTYYDQPIPTNYGDMKGDTKYQKWGCLR